MKTRPTAAALTVPAALLLVACGTTDTTSGSDATPAANSSADCASDKTETSTGPVSLTDSFGRKVELEKPAERVAVLEWQQTEDLLSLCVTPVAVADAKGFSTWSSAEELPEGITDVGLRNEPNLETLFGTTPDLVVIEAYTAGDDIIKQLEKYDVPVLATKGADAKDPVANMLATFDLIAEATGREERAEVVTDEFEASLEQAKEAVAVADADVETTDFVYFDGWIQGGNVALRPFGQGSMMGELGEAIGLDNVYDGEVDPAYGLGQTDIEGISEYGDAMFFHTGTKDPAGDFVAELDKNKVWQQIPAVEEGRVHPFPEGIWTFGGPRSAEQVLDAYVAAVTD